VLGYPPPREDHFLSMISVRYQRALILTMLFWQLSETSRLPENRKQFVTLPDLIS
jgi:hypothetical protein